MALTRTHSEHEEIEVKVTADEAFRRLEIALRSVGRITSTQPQFMRLVGRVGSGALNMNRADVTIQVVSQGDASARMVFNATAQEGLIPQGTSAKAITRILDAFSMTTSS